MGTCCSQAIPKSSASSGPPAFIPHSTLRSRPTPASPPSHSQVQALLDSYQNWAYCSFARRLESALSGKSATLECRPFEEVLKKALEEAINYYRSLFLQGSPGEIVSFESILQGEDTVGRICRQDFALFEYCNLYRSFVLCSALKKRLIESELLSKHTPNARILRLYDQEAAGAYRLLCRNDLEILLSQYTQSSAFFILSELKKQSVADREILRREKNKAEELSRRPVPEEFRSNSADLGQIGADSYGVLQSRLSVIDLISRLPEEEGKEGEYFTLQGEIVAKGPIKKHKSAEDRPKMPIWSTLSEEDSCSSQKIGKFELNIDEEDPSKA